MSVVLADLGGTHLRLAFPAADMPRVEKYKIADYQGIADILTSFAPDISQLYLASAIAPRDGRIEDTRFQDQSHWVIDLQDLEKVLSLEGIVLFNDLEAAAYALPALQENQRTLLMPAARDDSHFSKPPSLLVGIGTGIGHAYLFSREEGAFVQNTHGGHIPIQAFSAEQRDVVLRLQERFPKARDWIVEDVVSGHGLMNLMQIVGDDDALRLFWEFLGLYCNLLVSLPAAYGGLYLTGGVMDRLMEQGKVDMAAFQTYFRPAMVPVVSESLSSVPVYYCKEPHMPIAGLNRLYWNK